PCPVFYLSIQRTIVGKQGITMIFHMSLSAASLIIFGIGHHSHSKRIVFDIADVGINLLHP
ncbi:MAG: hypothetical protein RQ824_11690, partial [bacterium]|nr:hypothetical protein [bacterium]